MTDSVDAQFRDEWRSLGFYVDHDDERRARRLIGSRAGLLRFRDLLLGYVSNPTHELMSEHAHFGPYGNLEVMTWSKAGMDGHSIHGSLTDLKRLAILVEGQIELLDDGGRRVIREAYASDAEFSLVLELQSDDFDPSVMDDFKGSSDAG